MSTKNEISKEQLESFCSVTGSTAERATFYLEAANGDLDLAIGTFFEESNNDMPEEIRPPTGQFPNSQNDEDDDDDEDYEEEEDAGPARRPVFQAQPPNPKPKNTSSAKQQKSNIFTLNSLNDEEDEDDREERQGQAFYAGGSETSGQQILGPPRKKPDEIIKNLFEKAKEHGATEVQDQSEAAGSSKKPVVYGTGYRLGTGNEPTEIIKGPERPKPPKNKVLKLWKNGFNVDDGPLRLYSDPANREFLADIERGEPPRELLRQAEGAEVHMDMQDCRDEEFVPPKAQYVLYNDGYKLGSPTPTVVSNASPNDEESNEREAKKELNLDESKPMTNIQVRLSNGTRLIIKANQSHRVSDLRLYLNRARPEYSKRVYSLMTSFPNKEITNESESLQQANLLNAVIILKLKE